MTEPRWLDPDAAAQYLSLRLDSFSRKVRLGVIPEPSYSLGERTPRWWSPDLDAVMRVDTASTNSRTAVEALVEKIEAQAKGRTGRSANTR